MNRLVIIGNGFDLAHGLKTSYSDFLLDYLKRVVNQVKEIYIYEDKILKVKKDHVGMGVDRNWIDNFNSFKDLKDATSITWGFNYEFKSSFFKEICKDIENKNWVDIESLYYNELKKYIPENRDPTPLNKELEELKEKLFDYIFQQSYLFEQEPKNSKEIENLFNYNLLENTDQSHSFLERTDKINHTMILNFNYTNVAPNYFSNPKRFLINNIHGNISDKKSIVFGFGDELDDNYQKIGNLNNNLFFEHIKSFNYFQNNSYQRLLSFIYTMKFEVYVLGHSLGLSDRTLLNQIFDSDKLERVKLFYYIKTENDTNDFIDKTYEISRHFSDKGRMRGKIVPFTESEPMPQIKK